MRILVMAGSGGIGADVSHAAVAPLPKVVAASACVVLAVAR